jgi:hypothetical protein
VAYWQIVDKFDNNFIIHVTISIKHDLEYVLNFFYVTGMISKI